MNAAVDSEHRGEALTAFLDAWEMEHGALTTDELAAAERALGLPGSSVL